MRLLLLFTLCSLNICFSQQFHNPIFLKYSEYGKIRANTAQHNSFEQVLRKMKGEMLFAYFEGQKFKFGNRKTFEELQVFEIGKDGNVEQAELVEKSPYYFLTAFFLSGDTSNYHIYKERKDNITVENIGMKGKLNWRVPLKDRNEVESVLCAGNWIYLYTKKYLYIIDNQGIILKKMSIENRENRIYPQYLLEANGVKHIFFNFGSNNYKNDGIIQYTIDSKGAKLDSVVIKTANSKSASSLVIQNAFVQNDSTFLILETYKAGGATGEDVAGYAVGIGMAAILGFGFVVTPVVTPFLSEKISVLTISPEKEILHTSLAKKPSSRLLPFETPKINQEGHIKYLQSFDFQFIVDHKGERMLLAKEVTTQTMPTLLLSSLSNPEKYTRILVKDIFYLEGISDVNLSLTENKENIKLTVITAKTSIEKVYSRSQFFSFFK